MKRRSTHPSQKIRLMKSLVMGRGWGVLSLMLQVSTFQTLAAKEDESDFKPR